MTRLVRAELLKLRSTNAWWLLLGLALAYCLLATGAFALAGSRGGDSPDLHSATGLGVVYGWVSQAYAFTLILGVLGVTTEYRHMTITATLLAVPRRGRLLLAKLLAYLVAGFVYAVVIVGVTFGFAAAVLSVRGLPVTAPGLDLPQIMLGGVLTITLYAPMGLAVGALVRNQVAAIVGTLIYFWWVETLLIFLLPAVGRWLPGGAAQAMLHLDLASMAGGRGAPGGGLLSWWAGAGVFIGYAALLTALGGRVTMRRDVT
ncbi:MAG TPA: ABC transporter permease [Streptosporangiaceae bacterium]|jgi:hypothetical protein